MVQIRMEGHTYSKNSYYTSQFTKALIFVQVYHSVGVNSQFQLLAELKNLRKFNEILDVRSKSAL